MVYPGLFYLFVNYCSYGLFNDALSVLDYTASMAGRSGNDDVEWHVAAGTKGKTTWARICSAEGEIQTGQLFKCKWEAIGWPVNKGPAKQKSRLRLQQTEPCVLLTALQETLPDTPALSVP